ncbi:hypothetical protein BS47DRAFT_1359953 [Hydnum rufescens UP504]|uniref:Golgi apparatus membrane protein TVP38 n=1 Tax=Hydnum rufescens UP504 TaxID=1448309 RepID=A0A9P6B3M5_9AGAM|nr:hypothetical protein BS47DRAFT_1359953 [Hydnum rufescens UP504]
MSNSGPGSYGLDPYGHSHSGQFAYSSQHPGDPPRTPSPTPSELVELNRSAYDLRGAISLKKIFRKKYIPWLIAIVLILVLVVLTTIYHTQIVNWLAPLSRKLKTMKAGFLIPIAILFVISFPPLFGHEIVGVLCGLVWGLWVGFAIVAAGTFLGEVGNFYAFRYICTARGEKLERTSISYGCLARVVRDGGFLVALVARSVCYSWAFLAAILSMPKQLIIVYLGVVIEESGSAAQTKKSKTISTIILIITFLVTVLAAWWILHLMNKVKPEVMRQRRKARALKNWQAGKGSEVTGDAFNPNDSDEELAGYPAKGGAIPLPASVPPQRWDAHGHAVPLLYDPPPPETRRRGVNSGDYVDWDVPKDPRTENITMHAPRPKYASESAPFTSSPFADPVPPPSEPLQQTPSPSRSPSQPPQFLFTTSGSTTPLRVPEAVQ